MWTEFRQTLRRLRGQIIGWSIGLGLYGVMMVYFYDTVAQMEELQQMIESYPPELMAFFDSVYSIATPAGYLETYYFSLMNLIVGIFAVGAAAKLLAGEEERGILDLVLAHPVSQTALFWGRLLGFVAATAIILLIGWLGWAVPSGSAGSYFDPLRITLTRDKTPGPLALKPGAWHLEEIDLRQLSPQIQIWINPQVRLHLSDHSFTDRDFFPVLC